MDKMIAITRPDKRLSYSVWPGLKSYLETALTGTVESAVPNASKMEVTLIGKETVDGHPCEKNRVVVTDAQGTRHESTVWNATDLKQFPVRIETMSQGQSMRLDFQEVKLAKPAGELFEIPSGYTRYANMQEMMMTEMTKQAREEEEPGRGESEKSTKKRDGRKVGDLLKKKLLPF
ncbi:MAG: hypothetical protein FJ404_00355 [Verrucomicrobia bacterium]|nr:hypothetical protein [Verrucomicrobiota bacterium]